MDLRAMQGQSQTKSKPVALPSQEQEPQRQQTPKSEGALHCLPQSAARQRPSADSASGCQEWQLEETPAHSDSLVFSLIPERLSILIDFDIEISTTIKQSRGILHIKHIPELVIDHDVGII